MKTAKFHKTEIEYADYVLNPLRAWDPDTGRKGWACVKYSRKCDHCWAEQINLRFGTHRPYNIQNFNAVNLYLDEDALQALAVVNPAGPFKHGERPWIFMCDMVDWLMPAWGDYARRVLAACTKRPDMDFLFLTARYDRLTALIDESGWPAPTKNIYIGLTIADETTPGEAIDNLFRLYINGWKVWVSHEPAIGPINLDPFGFLSFLVFGGESGNSARPAKVEWARKDLTWCRDMDIPFFFKQWGKHVPEGQVEGFLDGLYFQMMPTKKNSCSIRRCFRELDHVSMLQAVTSIRKP